MKPHENDIHWGILSLVVFKYRFLKIIFVYLLLCRVSVPVWAFSGCGGLGLLSGLGAWASHCGGFSCAVWALGCSGFLVVAPWPWSTGFVVVACGRSCSVACRIFLDQGLNLFVLHWQADSLPLRHQRSPYAVCYA